MKKLLLSLFVIATFAVYSFHQHDEDSANVIAQTPPAKTTANQTTTQPSTPSTPTTSTTTSTYKNGQYTGTSEDAFYGFVQVRATISGGKLVSVEFLSYPNDHRESVQINTEAMPILQQEAIKAQTSRVDIVSGATDTSQAFIRSLSSALNSALAA